MRKKKRVVPPFLVRVVIERHAPRRNYRTSSHHERSRQTGDWRRGGDPPPLAHLILSTTLLTASAPLPCSSQLPHVSSSQPRQPHSTFHPYPTLPFPLFPYRAPAHALSLSRPLSATPPSLFPVPQPLVPSLSLPHAAPCYDPYRSHSPTVLLERVNPLSFTPGVPFWSLSPSLSRTYGSLIPHPISLSLSLSSLFLPHSLSLCRYLSVQPTVRLPFPPFQRPRRFASTLPGPRRRWQSGGGKVGSVTIRTPKGPVDG